MPKINTFGMNLPTRMPSGRIVITPIVDAKGPLRILGTLEQRLSQYGLMWFLRHIASPFMADTIVDRFAYEGDATVGGPWLPLAQYTVELKRRLGYPEFTNERTGEMMHHLAYNHAIEATPEGALLRIPDSSDAVMEQKLRTAQEGEAGSANAFGGDTPARPVLGIGVNEESNLERLFDAYLWTGIA